MLETDLCHFAIETPTNWSLPAGRFWVAGWLLAKPDRSVRAVRLRLDERIFGGMFGLPRPEIEAQRVGVGGLPHAGFSFLIEGHRGARMLRLEAYDGRGHWIEFWRTPVQCDSGAERPPRRLVDPLTDGILTLLKNRRAAPAVDALALALQQIQGAVTEALNVLPSPPFWGALEEPTQVGNSQYNKLPVTGWILHEQRRIVRVFASADPLMEHTLAYGLERTDALGMFPDHPYAARSRFVGLIDLAEDGLDPAGLRVFAELDDGTWHLVFHQHFHQLSWRHKERLFPVFRRRTLLGAVAQLWRACRREGVGVAFADWWRAVRAAGEWYRQQAPTATFACVPPVGSVVPAELPRKRRLLLVTHNLNFEGAPIFLREYAAWLARTAGWTFEVVSLQEGPLRADFEAFGARVRVVDWARSAGREDEATLAARIEAVRQTVEWGPIDLVVGNTVACYWAVPLARAAGRPSLLYIHESATISRFFGKALPRPMHRLVEEALLRATRVSFLCQATMDYYEASASAGNFRIVAGWIDVEAIDRFRRAHDRAALRRKHGIGADEVVIANIGSVCERKGQDTFIRAVEVFKRRQRDGRRYRFLMVGGRESAFQDLLRANFPLLGLGEEVAIVPETREVYDYFGLADVFVCSSYEESFPRVVLEAMAFGVPIVSTDVHGIPEIVRAGREARLVLAGDPVALAEALQAAVAEGPTGAMVAAARERVNACFACEVVFPRHAALATEILREAGTGTVPRR